MKKKFSFNFYGLCGDVEYELCSDETMLGRIQILGAISRFSYNAGVDILPVIGGCGQRQEREFLYNLIKNEYKKEVKELRYNLQFYNFFEDRHWLREVAMSIED